MIGSAPKQICDTTQAREGRDASEDRLRSKRRDEAGAIGAPNRHTEAKARLITLARWRPGSERGEYAALPQDVP
jgi:hypothetical protein